MKITQSGQFLIQLTRLWAFNCFLVREADGFTLIDTNLPGSAAAILQAAQQLGLLIAHIALTHSHQDHAASLDALHLALPQAQIAFPAREARLLAGDLSLDPAEPQSKLRGGYITVNTQPARLLQPGDRLGSLEVVPAPGHTPGHVAFLDTRDRSLIAGDAFQTQFGIAVSGTLKLMFPFPALATWHKPTALQTARALRALNPSRLAVGHGPTLDNPLAAMDAAILAAER
jgi:glyoxylase-like metal-dependent hydrolase (beta-lactamase superfamily II)